MWHLYLDESGDLGFDFSAKQPTQFLTIAVLATSHRETVKAIQCAVRNTLRRKVNRKNKAEQELKGVKTTLEVKRHFYNQISDCEFGIYAVTLAKAKLLASDGGTQLVADTAHLYNYLARCALDSLPLEKAVGAVELSVDKSKGKREIAEFNDAAVAQLRGRLDPKVRLSIFHRDSCHDAGLSAVDMFSWGIFRWYERNDDEWFSVFKDKLQFNTVIT